MNNIYVVNQDHDFEQATYVQYKHFFLLTYMLQLK